jgi:hypothetical protein
MTDSKKVYSIVQFMEKCVDMCQIFRARCSDPCSRQGSKTSCFGRLHFWFRRHVVVCTLVTGMDGCHLDWQTPSHIVIGGCKSCRQIFVGNRQCFIQYLDQPLAVVHGPGGARRRARVLIILHWTAPEANVGNGARKER